MELITGENDKGRRLDRILRKALPDYPLPLIHKYLRLGLVMVNGNRGEAQDRVDSGAKIEIPSFKTAHYKKNSGEKASHFNSPPDIIWENCGLLAVNKPAGLAVHGPNSLDVMVRSFLAGKLPQSLSFKPGPLHRLDKPSSGIVIFSASLEGARLFSSLLQDRKVKKAYLAIVNGTAENEEIWQDCLVRNSDRRKTYTSCEAFGKEAVTKITPLAADGRHSLIRAEIITGRTHQIRAQAAAHGYPLLGDVKYGAASGKKQRTNKNGQKADFFLHAWKMEFLEYSIEAPLPSAFTKALVNLRLQTELYQ